MSVSENQHKQFHLRKVRPIKVLLSHKGPQILIVAGIALYLLQSDSLKTALVKIFIMLGLYIALFWVPVPALRDQPLAATIYRILRHRIGGNLLERNKQVPGRSRLGIAVRGRPVARPANHFKWLGKFWSEPFEHGGNIYGIVNDRKEKTLSMTMYAMGQSQRLTDPVRQWPQFWNGWSNMIDQLPALGSGFHRFQTTTFTRVGGSAEFNNLMQSIDAPGEIPDFILERIWNDFRETAAQETYFTMTILPRLLPRNARKPYGGRDVLVERMHGLYRNILPSGPSPIDLDAAVILDVNELTKVMRRTLDPFESWVNNSVPRAKANDPQSLIHPDHALPDFANFGNPDYSVLQNGALARSWYIDEYGAGGMSFSQLAEFYSLAIPKVLTNVIGVLPDEVARRWADFSKNQAGNDLRRKQRREMGGGRGPSTEDEVRFEAIEEHAEEVARGKGASVTMASYLTIYAHSKAELDHYTRAVHSARLNANLVLHPLNDEQWKGLGSALPMGRGLDTSAPRSVIKFLNQ